jgi:hypothetical protein
MRPATTSRTDMTRTATLVSAEVFNDFLDMSAHLLDNGYYQAAGSLVGAVLEDSLRRVAVARSMLPGVRELLTRLPR